jgi:hypothetical protein
MYIKIDKKKPSCPIPGNPAVSFPVLKTRGFPPYVPVDRLFLVNPMLLKKKIVNKKKPGGYFFPPLGAKSLCPKKSAPKWGDSIT